MLRIDGHPRAACDGTSRRAVLEAAGAGLLGLTLPRLLAAEEAAVGRSKTARAKSVIFLFLFGGPSQLETFDLKPDAPDKIRGPFKPIACKTPGLLISEALPRMARISDKYCVIRTMSHSQNDHSAGAHYIQTGKAWHIPIGGGFTPTPNDWPSVGSIVEYLDQRAPGGMGRDIPSYAVIPNTLGRIQQEGQYPRPGEHAGWLGRRYNPLTTMIDKKDGKDNPYWRDCSDSELTYQLQGLASDAGLQLDRLRTRVGMLEQFDLERRRLEGGVSAFDRFRQRALALVTSDRTRQALDVRRETAATRDRYGRHLFGQSALVARRLIEAGVRYVTVHYDACDGYSWDSHLNSTDVTNHLLPTFDQTCSALLADLEERGLLDETLVVAMGEMGRTPLANASWGRNHWSTLFPAVLAGAGVRGGGLYGASDKDAAHAIEHIVGPERLAATLYHALGVDPELRVADPQGRPINVVVDGAAPILDVFG